MGYMFEDAAKFSGGDLSMWNVRNVRDMRYMFCDALAFTGSVSTWDVGAVENMEAMVSTSHGVWGMDLWQKAQAFFTHEIPTLFG